MKLGAFLDELAQISGDPFIGFDVPPHVRDYDILFRIPVGVITSSVINADARGTIWDNDNKRVIFYWEVE